MKRLQSKVNSEKACSLLKTGYFRRGKTPDKIEELGIPFYLFRVFVDPGEGDIKYEHVLVDAMGGVFSFFESDGSEDSENVLRDKELRITEVEARVIAKREYLFYLLHRNLRTKLKSRISRIELMDTILFPFWVGYFVHTNHYSIEVLDGLNGKKQLGSLKKVVVDYLTEEFKSETKTTHKPPGTVHSLNR